MEKQARFPYQFFVVTFVWSWLVWLPLVLASAGILPLGKNLLSVLIPPVTIVAMFGPAAGTFYCLKNTPWQGCRAPISTRFAGFPFGLAGVAPSHTGAGREHLDRVEAAGALG